MNNLNKNEEIFEVENQYWVNLYHDLKALKENKHFQNLILNAYFKDKAIDATSLLSRSFPQGRDNRSDLLEDLISISNLQYFFIMIENLGNPEPLEDSDENKG